MKSRKLRARVKTLVTQFLFGHMLFHLNAVKNTGSVEKLPRDWINIAFAGANNIVKVWIGRNITTQYEFSPIINPHQK